MKIVPVTAALTAMLAVSAVASPVLAQDYGDYRDQAGYACQQTKHQSQTTGGILGALAGAVIGSNLAAHGGGRTGGALLGAAAGAAVGSNIGVSSAHDSGACRAASQGYAYDRPVYAARYIYEPPAYGARYAYDPDAQYRVDQYRAEQYRAEQYREAQYRRDRYRNAEYRYRYSHDEDGGGYDGH